MPTRGGDLYQDVETVSRAVEVKLGSVSDVTVDYISVSTDDATIYDSTTEEEIKSHLTVTAYYSDDISHTVSDYDVYVTRSDGNATILIQYGETDNPNNQQTVSLKLGSNNISKVERIVLDNGYVESYYDENDLKHAMDVIVSRTDNKLHYLEDYNVTDDLYPGSGKPVDSEEYPVYPYVEKTVYITPIDNGVSLPDLKKGFEVKVNPNNPDRIVAQLVDDDAFDAFVGGPYSAVTVMVFYSDFEFKTVQSGYHFLFENSAGDRIDSSSTEDVKSKLEAGSYKLYVVYTENGIPKTSSAISIQVNKVPLAYPSIMPETLTYSADIQSWAITDYVEGITEHVISCSVHGTLGDSSDCEAYVGKDTDGTYKLFAKHQGTYTLSFKLSSEGEKNYIWDGNAVSYNATISRGQPIILLDSDGGGLSGWIYGEVQTPKFIAKLSGGSKILGVGEIEWNEANITFSKGMTEIECKYSDITSLDPSSFSAGNWTLKVYVPEEASNNLLEASGEFPFKISKNTLTPTAVDSVFKYSPEKTPQSPEINITGVINYGNFSEMYSCVATGYDAGTYDIEVVLKEDYRSNYEWSGGDKTEFSTTWVINPLTIADPSATPLIGDSNYLVYDGSSKQWMLSNNQGTVFDTDNFYLETVECSINDNTYREHGLTLTNDGLEAVHAGKYDVIIGIRDNALSHKNYAWAGENNPEISITISQRDLGLTVKIDDRLLHNSNALWYDDPEPSFVSVDDSTDGFTIEMSGLLEGDSNEISLSIDTNYEQGSPPNSTDNPYKITAKLNSRDYCLAISTWYFDVAKAPLEITRATVGEITYLDEAPVLSDYSFFSGEKCIDSLIGDKIDVEIRTEYSKGCDAKGYDDSSNGYEIRIIATSDYYDIPSTGSLGYLIVNRLGVYLDWTSADFEFDDWNTGLLALKTDVSDDGMADETFDLVGLDIDWYSVTGSTTEAVTSFDEGDYRVVISMDYDRAKNYTFIETKTITTSSGVETHIRAAVSDEGKRLQAEFHITYKQIPLGISVDEGLDRHYGTLDDEKLKGSITLTVPEEYKDDLSGIEYDLKDFSFRVGSSNTIEGLDSGTYTLTVYLNGVENLYIYASTNITILDREVVVIGPSSDDVLQYNGGDQTITFTLPDQQVYGGVEVKWEFNLDGYSSVSTDNSITLTIPNANAGQYTFTYELSAENHIFNYGPGQEHGSIVVDVQPAPMDIVFTGSDESDEYAGVYTGVYDESTADGPRPSDGSSKFVEPTATGLEGSLTPGWSFTVYTESGDKYSEDPIITWNGLLSVVAIPGEYKVEYEASCTNYFSGGEIFFDTSNADLSFVYKLDDGDRTTLSNTIEAGYSGRSHELTIEALRDGNVVDEIEWALTIDNVDQVVDKGGVVTISKSSALSYEVKIKAEKEYYNTNEFTFTFKINKANIDDVQVPLNPSFTYGDTIDMGGSATSSVSGLDVDWTWTFEVSKLDGETTADFSNIVGWDDLISRLQNEDVGVGTYKITYVVSESNHNTSTTRSFDVSITKRTLTLMPGFEKLTYGDYAPGDDRGDIATLETMVGNFAYGQSFDVVFGESASLECNYSRGSNASVDNSYCIDGRSLKDPNYDTSGLIFRFAVDPFTIELSIDDVTAEYNLSNTAMLSAIIENESQLPFGSENVFELEIHIKNEDGSVGDQISAEDAVRNFEGIYYIVAVPTSGNYVIDAEYGELAIGKQTLKITFNSRNFPYAGSVLQPSDVIDLFTLPPEIFTEQFISENVTLSFVSIDGDNLDESTGYPIEAGKYRVSMILSETCGYAVSMGAEAIFEITKASYNVNVNFGSELSVTYGDWDGDGYEFPIFVTDTSIPGTANSKPLKSLLVAESGYDRDADLIVTYYIDGEEIEGYPIFDHVKAGKGSFEVEAKFSGSENYNVPADISTYFTVYQASNGWSDVWDESYKFVDSEYSELNTPSEIGAEFGTVVFEYYFGDSAVPSNKLDKAPSSDSPVGTYFVRAFVTETDDFEGIQPYEYTFTVSKKVLDPVWEESAIKYTGVSVSNTLVIRGDGGSVNNADTELIQRLVGERKISYTLESPGDDGSDYEFDSASLSMTAVSEGQYTIILIIEGEDADRYTFAKGEGVDTASMSWYITSDDTENYWTTIPHIDSWTYGETPGEPTGEAKYNSEEIQFTYLKVGESSTPTTTRPSEPGTYEMVATVPGGTIHASDGSGVSYAAITHKVEFTISKISVSIPENEAFPRDGQSHQPYVTNEYYTVEGDVSALEIGNYDVILSLKDPEHCMWSDGTVSDKTLFWRIVPTGDLVEEYFSVDTTPETYNGSAFEKAVVCKNSDLKLGEDYEISYESNLAAGTGYVIITGLNEFEGSELKFPFQINKARPVLDFVNNGFEKSDDSEAFTLNPYTSGLSDGDIRWTSSDPSVAEVDPATGEVTVKAIGQVTITATFVGDDNREQVSDSYDLNIEDGQTEVYVDRVVYIRVPVTDPDDPDDPTDDKPDEPAIVYKNDNTLYIILLLVLAAVCVCFAAYIMYTHRKQEDQGGGQI